ncbi:FAD-binding protein [Denitrobacterium detoxificans]|uniref:FAD-dependent oxidoreductase n=1 Tax=Denitrobacterium detoxificans TaxID=79604 RepID=UPI0026ED6C39|nr:FAD-binding protein [Denitrobacterium detoxificans]MBE6465562.1 FAD-binding protein [Denitrobacterium detoxificans]
MSERNVSRRNFVGAAALGAMAMGAAAITGCSGGAAKSKSAEKAASTASGSAAGDYQNIYSDGVNLMPARKATCPGPRGPVAFESNVDASAIKRDENFDVVVVGAGVGGLIAALKAADMGAKVLLLEKMTRGRGCFECFGAVDAKVQKEAGTQIDRAVLLDEIYRSAYYRIRPDAPRTYVERSGEATDFWQEMLNKGANGFVITPVAEAPATNGFPAMTQFIPSELGFYDSPALPQSASVRSGLSGIYVCLEMQDIAKNAYPNNIDMRFSTPAVKLERDSDGRVTGVIARDDNGYFRANASQGVILATGGYDANPEMMEAWTRPEDYANSSWWNPCWGTTGDGHMMGLAVGAQMDPIPHPVMNFRWGTPSSFADFRTWNAVYLGILVNGRGQRFVREDGPFQVVSNAQNAQPAYGKNCWYIFDDGMSEGLENGGFEEFKSKGWLYEADTAEELAKACGIDPEGLKATLERYAGFFANGRDEDFDRDLTQTAPFTGGKLYAFTTNSNVLATTGGLCIDGNCSVLDVNDAPIPGLFACGNASGSFFAGNYPRHIPGTSIGRAITFGFVAAESAVNGTIGEAPIVDGNAPDLFAYGEGNAVGEDARTEAEALGLWDKYNPIHGSSTDYTDTQLGGNAMSCNNCHEYRAGGETVADNMKWLSE